MNNTILSNEDYIAALCFSYTVASSVYSYPITMPLKTRGQRHLTEYLGTDAATWTRKKKASDVIPVLEKRSNLTDTSDTTRVTLRTSLAPEVIAYLQVFNPKGAVNRLKGYQLRLLQELSTPCGGPTFGEAHGRFLVKRAAVPNLLALADTIAVSALQRRALAKGNLEGCTLFVLVENGQAAKALQGALTSRYGLEVLLLEEDKRYPCFSLSTLRTSPSRARSRTLTEVRTEGEAAAVAPQLEAAVVVGTPEAFLKTDARSNIWKFIGAYVVALTGPSSTPSESLIHQLGNSAQQVALSQHRRRCLGHTTLACILSTDSKQLGEPLLDWLTTLTSEGATLSAAVNHVQPEVTKATLREPITVHYAVAEGGNRFGFLVSLMKNLQAHTGLVVHFATKESCGFMYDVLYGMLDDVLGDVQLLSDYDGNSQFSSVATAEGRAELCTAFDEAVQNRHQPVVLLSCYALTPSRGSVFLQYDLIPDVPNYNEFVSSALTPGATRKEATLVTRDVTARSRKRSISPKPIVKRSRLDSGSVTPAPPVAPIDACYRYIIILLRPNEVEGALRHLRSTALRYCITYAALPHKPSQASYLLQVERLRSMNKKLFAIQNAAYHAYKAIMTAYCTMGPRDVYNEQRLKLEHVAAEFGYTDLPLLDLRLRDTPFRPKEDLYKAARQKQAQKQRADRKFADKFIVGKAAEEHVADV